MSSSKSYYRFIINSQLILHVSKCGLFWWKYQAMHAKYTCVYIYIYIYICNATFFLRLAAMWSRSDCSWWCLCYFACLIIYQEGAMICVLSHHYRKVLRHLRRDKKKYYSITSAMESRSDCWWWGCELLCLSNYITSRRYDCVLSRYYWKVLKHLP
jgi:hypothetical protein